MSRRPDLGLEVLDVRVQGRLHRFNLA
jgi:hypothetical protein